LQSGPIAATVEATLRLPSKYLIDALPLQASAGGMKKPNPSPKWFGFHEIFHALTIAGFICHYVGISLITYR